MFSLKKNKRVWVVICLSISSQSTFAFHKDVYEPRVPKAILAQEQQVKSPYPVTPERIEAGRKVYFGVGFCVTCHSKDGTGVNLPGHPSRDFTDAKWQKLRTDGELMWVLKNGSPGTGMPIRVGTDINEEEGWNVIQFIRTFEGK
ncbi:Cytochrome C oxidase, cbb3-type, subunit III [Candidatus Nitrotoga sp. HW29]|uniref:c-type cytochrome n=1 Tax=Candidatus Nitrotoga sp. HW29 TaxID=2886963 RepID=UPI001EF1ADB4|nr:cytochrome c [Candidatus Nitrotoga sp. HW29]CAH1904280.1 Cytochrome C oxidase, cbb3-type, subunit III [Candidatus Nitrotoga sp. HW29]